MSLASGRARPRVGLLGNPSDGYRGRVLAFTFEDFEAEVTLEPAEHLEVWDPSARRTLRTTWEELWTQGVPAATTGVAALLLAALRVFQTGRAALAFQPSASPANGRPRGFRMIPRSTIPRQVGLGGSSALIIAALKAFQAWLGGELPSLELARRALLAETQELGLAAGPQDRVVQACEGLLDMDFGGPWTVRPLDPAILPPLVLAWNPDPGESSDHVHSELRRRWEQGDPEVVRVMRALASLAAEGATSLERGDAAGLMAAVNRNFDLRTGLCEISAVDRHLVSLSRARGAAAKLCGSGGAVVAVVSSEEAASALLEAYHTAGYPALRPRVSRPSPQPEER